jgi:hypothetical protein
VGCSGSLGTLSSAVKLKLLHKIVYGKNDGHILKKKKPIEASLEELLLTQFGTTEVPK